MKKFAYRFKSLLNIRGIQEEQAEREFREALKKYSEEVEKLDNLRNEAHNLLEEMTEQRKANTDMRIQVLFQDYLRHLWSRIETQKEEIKKAETEMEIRREELIESIKERKMLENLQIKDMDKYLKELNRWEQGIIDDLSTLRFGNELVAHSGIPANQRGGNHAKF